MNKKGFTLVELIVTIAILLSITLVAIPSVSKMKSNNEKKQKGRIEQIIIDAKDTYCDFNTCNSEIEIKALIDQKLLDRDTIDNIIDIDNCKITNDSTKLNQQCFK